MNRHDVYEPSADGVAVTLAAGLGCLPELCTLCPQLAANADNCDPLAVQRRPGLGDACGGRAPLCVYYVDDHFVPYVGVRPVGRGWNNKHKQD